MHMLHMHISMDIIITLSFFITDFLLSSVLNGVSALDGGIVTLSAGFVNPLFYIPAICKKIRQQSPTVFVCFAARIILSYPPKHSLTCCAFTQREMKKSHQAALDGSQSGTKASQNSPPAMAANNLDHFLPRHVRGKKYFARRECFSPIYGRKNTGRSDSYFIQKGIALLDKLKKGAAQPLLFSLSFILLPVNLPPPWTGLPGGTARPAV